MRVGICSIDSGWTHSVMFSPVSVLSGYVSHERINHLLYLCTSSWCLLLVLHHRMSTFSHSHMRSCRVIRNLHSDVWLITLINTPPPLRLPLPESPDSRQSSAFVCYEDQGLCLFTCVQFDLMISTGLRYIRYYQDLFADRRHISAKLI